MAETPRSRGHYRGGAIRDFLLLDNGKSAIHRLFLRFEGGGAGGSGSESDEGAARGVYRLVVAGLALLAAQGQAYRAMVASVDAVHAGDTAAIVYGVVAAVDTRCLAAARTESAVVTFARVDGNAQQREARQESEHRPHRADGVAIGASTAPCEDRYYNKCADGNRESSRAFHPHIHLIERVTIGALGKIGKQVVALAINGRKQIGGDASVGAIGCKQRDNRTYPQHHSDDKQRQDAIAQPILCRGIGKTVFFLLAAAAHPRDDVLHHAQGADYRTIHAPHEQGEHHKKYHHAHIHRKECGQKL